MNQEQISLRIDDVVPEIINEPGRPKGFIGEVSSIDADQKGKFACTEELEEALSSVQ